MREAGGGVQSENRSLPSFVLLTPRGAKSRPSSRVLRRHRGMRLKRRRIGCERENGKSCPESRNATRPWRCIQTIRLCKLNFVQ
ncbi:hypothetical protein IEQ34_013294 [Dendrobium chrysotoxum]|uniref:Uncharacterized protein n=1 Tax=Dendrobium chrysotoxum TaxID=161865 RepID=A0AAV7G813_DENCH|nr:hypothetical protein IEQ34_013294 [Dendrobium chrysotoxum]